MVAILSDLLISRGIDPAGLEKHKRCEVCRTYAPELYENYKCSESVCRDLWGDLANLHWKKPSTDEKRDIKATIRDLPKAFLDALLRRSKP